MGKRTFSIVLALALVAGVFGAVPAGAQTTIPAEPNIVDPTGDANYIHDGHDSRLPIGRNHVTPAGSINATGDLLGVWFSHDQNNIRVHVHTATSPPSGWGLSYHVYTNPGEGPQGSSTVGCLRFTTLMPGSNQGGGTYQGPPIVNLHDRCNVGGNFFSASTPGEFEVAKLEDGSGITTSTWPRTASPLLADGGVLTTPYATAATYTTGHPQVGFVAVPIDNTDRGADYSLEAASVKEPPAEPEPPGKNDPPGKGKKKGCKKGKGKKKGACPGGNPGKPKPPVVSCAPYVPGEEGAEAETTVVTDAATEEKPVVVEFDAGPGAGSLGPYDETSSLFQNVQVDSANADAGLYVKLEFPNFHDYDLYLNYADGSTAANSGDFNAAAGHDLGGGSPDGAWEAGSNYEMVMGIRTADCDGYTARMVSWLTNGGAMTLSVWLGDVVADPNAPGGEALSTFYGLLGL